MNKELKEKYVTIRIEKSNNVIRDLRVITDTRKEYYQVVGAMCLREINGNIIDESYLDGNCIHIEGDMKYYVVNIDSIPKEILYSMESDCLNSLVDMTDAQRLYIMEINNNNGNCSTDTSNDLTYYISRGQWLSHCLKYFRYIRGL